VVVHVAASETFWVLHLADQSSLQFSQIVVGAAHQVILVAVTLGCGHIDKKYTHERPAASVLF